MQLFKELVSVKKAYHIISVEARHITGFYGPHHYDAIKKVLVDDKYFLRVEVTDLHTKKKTLEVEIQRKDVLYSCIDDQQKIARIPFDKGVILYQEIEGQDAGTILYFA